MARDGERQRHVRREIMGASARTSSIVAATAAIGMLLALVSTDRSAAQADSSSGPAWEQLVDAANREGRLKIAGHPSDLRRAAFMAFAEAYPKIKIEYVSIGSHGQADARLKAEWEAKVFD